MVWGDLFCQLSLSYRRYRRYSRSLPGTPVGGGDDGDGEDVGMTGSIADSAGSGPAMSLPSVVSSGSVGQSSRVEELSPTPVPHVSAGMTVPPQIRGTFPQRIPQAVPMNMPRYEYESPPDLRRIPLLAPPGVS